MLFGDDDIEIIDGYEELGQNVIDQAVVNNSQTLVPSCGEQLGVQPTVGPAATEYSIFGKNSALITARSPEEFDAQVGMFKAELNARQSTLLKFGTAENETPLSGNDLFNRIKNGNFSVNPDLRKIFMDKVQYDFDINIGPDNPAFIDATLSYQDSACGDRLEPNENGVLWRVSAAGVPHPDDFDKYIEQQRVIESTTNSTKNDLIKTIVINAETDIANRNLIVSITGKQPIDIRKKLVQAGDAKLYAFNFNKFDRDAAVKYALTYWENPNTPKYFDYGGVDCTNFVSQCWHAAGIPMSPAWFSENTIHIGENPERPLATRSWVGVEEFAKYMVNSGYAYLTNNRNDAQVGDVIQFQNEYGWHHSVIIVEIDKNGEIYYASHSDPYPRKPLSDVYPGKEPIRFLCVYRPTGTA